MADHNWDVVEKTEQWGVPGIGTSQAHLHETNPAHLHEAENLGEISTEGADFQTEVVSLNLDEISGYEVLATRKRFRMI